METALSTALEKQVWSNNYFSEYVRETGYSRFFGRSNNSIIITKYELQEEAGKTINIALLTRLKGAGVTGSQVLDGNEEELGNYNVPLSIDWRRNGVRVPKSTSYKTEINLFDAAKPALKSWEAEKMRDDITKSFLSVIPATTTTVPVQYGTITEVTAGSATAGGYEILAVNYIASEANKDAWLVLNADRVLFGALRANYTAGDHSAALATLDTTADKMTAAIGSLAKRMAKGANPHIRPHRTKGGREYFQAFVGPRAMRDLKADAVMTAANRDARPRDVSENPLFQDGDLIYDGVVYTEVPEIPTLKNAGASGTTDVEPFFLCGAQALAIAWGQEPTMRVDTKKDYEFRPGVAIEELVGVQKLFFNGVQQGMVTGYVAAPPDA